jgi:hypothetical protein
MVQPVFATQTDPEEFIFLLLDDCTHLALPASIEVLRVANLLGPFVIDALQITHALRWRPALMSTSATRIHRGSVGQTNAPTCY